MNRSRLAFVVGNGRARSVDAHRLRWRQLLPERPAQHQPVRPGDQPAGGACVKLATARTLYVFDKDTASPPKSNCSGDCAAMWPPVLAGTGTPRLDGVDASAVGTVTRTDGSKQLTLGGLPLYQFANDTKAGDVKGQAVGGIWWVVGPDGKKITTQVSDSGNNGY
jgi:predicted lipoprotein with Yx(FWY)xxD motif